MNPAWHEDAVRLRREGASVHDIAAATGKCHAQIYRVIRAVSSPVNHHMAAQKRGRDFDPQWPKKAVRLRRQGMQIAQIARKFDVTRQAVSKVCRKAGLPKGKPGGDWRKAGMPEAAMKAIGQKEGDRDPTI